MKPEEAIKKLREELEGHYEYLRARCYSDTYAWDQTEHKLLGVVALEKQIPEKPMFWTARNGDNECECPNCTNYLGVYKDNYLDLHTPYPYCPNCGKKLDWAVDQQTKYKSILEQEDKDIDKTVAFLDKLHEELYWDEVKHEDNP